MRNQLAGNMSYWYGHSGIGKTTMAELLEAKINELPQIRRRVHPWVYFEQYSFDETWDLLSKLHPHFSTLDRENQEHTAQVKFVYETFGGYPGSIVQFLIDLDSAISARPGNVDLRFLRSVHYLMTIAALTCMRVSSRSA
jgi:hypothetical protein